MDSNQNKISIFQDELNQECYSYGWGRGLKKATSLYSDNLMMKDKIKNYEIKLNSYRKEIKKLNNIINKNNLTDVLISNSIPINYSFEEGDEDDDKLFDNADEK